MYGNQELFVGVCYRTSSENVYGHGIHDNIRILVSEISSKNFVLFGDFRYRSIDSALNCYDSNVSLESRLFLDCVNDCFITQHVDFLTTNKLILNSIFSKEPDLVCNCPGFEKFWLQ